MPKTAILFGSIGALAETSDIQRRAYNEALSEAGLSWSWDEETYKGLLTMVGGRERLSLLSRATGAGLTDETVAAIHCRKTEIACAHVRAEGRLRPGAAALIAHAKDNGLKLGFVTTTNRPNIDAVLSAGGLTPADFDHIGDRERVARGKPAPDAYEAALAALGVTPDQALAVEDTAASVASAIRAGIATVATPGAFAADQDFSQADLVLDALGHGDRLHAKLLAMLE